MKKGISICLVLFAVSLFFGCAPEEKKEGKIESGIAVVQPAGSADSKELLTRNPTKEEIGKAVVCPVMGSKFKVNATTPVYDYKGKAYYMCCGQCVKDFKENPDKYAK